KNDERAVSSASAGASDRLCAMESLASVRMTANLNSMIRGQQGVEQAERAIVGSDVAHHVVDPDAVLGLDPLQASTLDAAPERLRDVEQQALFLWLPARTA